MPLFYFCLLSIIIVINGTSGSLCPECLCHADGRVYGVGDRRDRVADVCRAGGGGGGGGGDGGCALEICTGADRWHKSLCVPVARPLGWTVEPGNDSHPFPGCCARALPPLRLVPDVIDQLRFAYFLGVHFGNGARARQGNLLDFSQLKNPPTVTYDYIADPKHWYVLMMVDADAEASLGCAYLHWLVGNIPGRRVGQGEALAEYAPPPPTTRPHRYFLLLFRQPSPTEYRCDFDWLRAEFSVRHFVNQFRLGDPVAINAFRASADCDCDGYLDQD